MMNYILAFLFVVALIGGILALSRDNVWTQINKRLKEDEKNRKGSEDIEQQLRDEDKYDNNYRKRHS